VLPLHNSAKFFSSTRLSIKKRQSHFFSQAQGFRLKSGAKLLLFFDMRKYFGKKMQK
jgi:hypothetical protein